MSYRNLYLCSSPTLRKAQYSGRSRLTEGTVSPGSAFEDFPYISAEQDAPIIVVLCVHPYTPAHDCTRHNP